MSERQTALEPGTIRFHSWCEPPLEPGDYRVRVSQTVQELTDDPASRGSFTDEFAFSVDGPRFSLNPAEIYSVYPPKGQVGDFANSLPHIVFTRRTLPWEQVISPGPRAESGRVPWMALLLLSAADFPDGEFPETRTVRLAELINPAANAPYVGPRLELARHESADDLCTTIDLPWQLFQKVAPSEADLAYLAHVREVNTDHKETLAFLADGWFSVVLANRFPQPETGGAGPALPVENRACLVSLKGIQDYLPGGTIGTGPDLLDKSVRLALLASWSFHCRAASTFKASIDRLTTGLLRVPFDRGEAAEQGESPADDRVVFDADEHLRDACEAGYTALNHSTRLGEKTVSWYRGPLVPLVIPRETKYGFLPAADAALRYNPLDGMLDVTYAAAFQLGRLLGLQDRHFATALYFYRSDVRRQINRVLGRRRTQSLLGLEEEGEENELMASYLRTLTADPAASPPAGREAAEFGIAGQDNSAGSGKAGGGQPREVGNELRLTSDFDLKVPGGICRWLARLLLLYRVPFTYLVVDERMLPPDSIRFFHLDPGWLKCLLEGACSVGRSSSHDELVDEQLRDSFFKLAIDESQGVRTRTPEQRPGATEALVAEIAPEGQPWPHCSGFLLRSPIVKGWHGLEMRAWADSGEKATVELKALRLDRLAPDIMLCIFNGQVERIELRQPPEGMHFGAAPDGARFRKHHLRRLAADGQSGPGDQLGDDSSLAIPLRSGTAERVVDVAGLAQELRGRLDLLKARDDSREFTSADFGVEMVESPGRAVFDAAFNEPEKK